MKSKIYTKGGDGGYTSLVGGIRIRKNDKRLEAYGSADELNAFIGLLLSKIKDKSKEQETLLHIQNQLFSIGGYLATDCSQTPLQKGCEIEEKEVNYLENRIDEIDESLLPLRSFILPNGCEEAAIAHLCRTVCRRMERAVLSLFSDEELPQLLLAYINRLSDYFFVLSRKLNQDANIEETKWEKR